jgi:hypothetical protein
MFSAQRHVALHSAAINAANISSASQKRFGFTTTSSPSSPPMKKRKQIDTPSCPPVISLTGSAVSKNALIVFKASPFHPLIPPTYKQQHLIDVFNEHPQDKPSILASNSLNEFQIVDSLCFKTNKSRLQNHHKRSSIMAQQYDCVDALSCLYYESSIKEKMEERMQETYAIYQVTL